MAHQTSKIDLMEIPGVVYTPLQTANGVSNFICIPADPNLIEFVKDEQSKFKFKANMKMRMWQTKSEQRSAKSPSHKVDLQPHNREKYDAYITALCSSEIGQMDENQYNNFIRSEFGSSTGTSRMPSSRQEAINWYAMHKLRIGATWEDEDKAPAPSQPVQQVQQASMPQFSNQDAQQNAFAPQNDIFPQFPPVNEPNW